jgi:hypothetical protein
MALTANMPNSNADCRFLERIIMLNRRHCLTYIGTSAVAGLSPSLAFAQGKPLKILVGYPAGGLWMWWLAKSVRSFAPQATT